MNGKKRRSRKGTIDSALKGMHRVLRNRGIAHPVHVTFAPTKGAATCVRWECHIVNGRQVCGFVPVPC